MTATDPALQPEHAPAASRDATPEMMREAFRELHGRRLHGFTLLLTAGDRHAAAWLASDALAAGTTRLDELRHPERAAAWLRRRVVDRARVGRNEPVNDRLLEDLGADGSVLAAIARLDRLERAALIASAIERLDRRDVATIVGRGGDGLDRLIRRARERYMGAYGATAAGGGADGPIVAHVREIARRAMA
jgi:DNA-directed RNA polymerase specialized sigma24 family protein